MSMSSNQHSPKPRRRHLRQVSAGLVRSTIGTLAVLLLSLGQTRGQGTLQIGFEGPPVLRPGAGDHVAEYHEGPVWFLAIPGTDGFVRRWSGDPRDPYNDTAAFLQATLGDSLMFGLDDGSSFDPVSVDLAEYSTVVPDAVTVLFVGYRRDGSTVTASFTTDGVMDGTGPLADFQTVYFGAEFAGVYRVRIPAYGWSLDNLIVSIPEPSTSTLLAIGAVLMALGSSRRKGQ